MSEPMTEAEQAVVDVLEGDSACSWHKGCDVEDCYGPRAAAIVAKLRPFLAAEALTAARRDISNHREQLRKDRSRMGQRFEGRLLGLEEAAGKLTTAIKALRTTTPEKENRP